MKIFGIGFHNVRRPGDNAKVYGAILVLPGHGRKKGMVDKQRLAVKDYERTTNGGVEM